jgi:putative peptide zinc metalloprotease protein
MTNSPPKLRPDLTIIEQRLAGDVISVVKDPITGEFFRLGEAERFIAQQLDGSTPVEVVRQRVEEKFETSLPRETLDQFIKTLEKGGLLENGKSRKKPSRPPRIRGTLLMQRVRFCDPDRLFNRIIGRIGFFFTPYFVVLSAALILFSMGVAITNWEDVRGDVARLFQISSLPLAFFTFFLVITAHEFAHGLTCKHFGGEVHELGFLLVYLQPALYCNVSDAWLLPEKSKRLWIGFAGPYFELFLWAIATLVWRVTDVETSINYMAFVVMTTSGVKTFFNFNPLIKLDGYYLLSDYLEIPNLRRKSFNYVGSRIRKLVGSLDSRFDGITLRQRRIFLAYGLTASIGSFSLLGFAVVKLGGYLIQNEQPMAFMFFAGLLGTKFRRRFRNLFSKASSASDMDDDFDSGGIVDARSDGDVPETGDAPKTQDVPQTRAEPEPRAAANAPVARPSRSKEPSKEPSKRRKKAVVWLKRALVAVALAGIVTPILFFGHGELKIRGQFNVLPIHNADVRAEVEGIIEEIYVDEGDEVKAGDMIARLSDRELRAELQKTEAEIAQNQAKLALLETGPSPEEIDVAKAAVGRAEEGLAYGSNRLVRDKALFGQNLLSAKDFEDTQERAATAASDLNEAKSKLKLLLRGSRPEDIVATKANIAWSETQRRFLEEQIKLAKVLSPITGIVATPSVQLKEMKHQLIKKGELIAKVYDIKTITAEIVVSEKDIGDVKVGEPVLLKARAQPEETFKGTVTAIATVAQINSSSSSGIFSSAGQAPSGATSFSRANVNPKTVLVTTRIDNSALLLKPEMTGQAKIFCGRKRILDLVTRRIARTVKVEYWSWW